MDALRHREEESIIVRPYFKGCVVQLDDIGHDTAAKLQPFSFLTIRTSDRNYQRGSPSVTGIPKRPGGYGSVLAQT